MSAMFQTSKLNGDISKWNVSNVTNMAVMFCETKFNHDIGKWNVSKVVNMAYMFSDSEFSKDVTNWKPLKLNNKDKIFQGSKLKENVGLPYWAEIDVEFLPKAIEAYHLNKKLNKDLPKNTEVTKKSNKIKV